MKRIIIATAACCALLQSIVSVALAVVVPQGFVVEDAYPGVAFNRPTAFAFTPDGRLLVAEKRGVVRVVENGVKLPEPMWSAENEVLNFGDRGLIGLTVDPDYAVNRWVYLLYSVDPDSDGVDFQDDAFGRLTRYQTSIANPNVFDLSTRQVLIGKCWTDGFPSGSLSHAIGALQWGADGSLFASCGDGAQYAQVDTGGVDPDMFLPGRCNAIEDIGARRAQFLGSLAGKILRINPETGCGYTSNPFFDGDLSSNRSRVWAYGLRNPFRFSFRPGTGRPDTSLADPGVMTVVDVGWTTWEEIDMVTAPGQNFGWPCFEGPEPQPLYQATETSQYDCSTMGTVENPSWARPPVISWHHNDPSRSTPPGLYGFCGGGGGYYTGNRYPEEYRGLYFFADFVMNWIAVAKFNENHELVDVTDFAEDAEGPVDFQSHPITGDIHYLGYRTGRFYRISYANPLAVEPGVHELSLSNAYPNPSAGSVSLSLELPTDQWVAWSVHDVAGREVWRAPSERFAAGRTHLRWNGVTSSGRSARPGLYFIRVAAGAASGERRFVLVR